MVTLFRVGLDYGEEVHESKNIRGMEQYDWLCNVGFFTSHGLHYIQGFFSGEIRA